MSEFGWIYLYTVLVSLADGADAIALLITLIFLILFVGALIAKGFDNLPEEMERKLIKASKPTIIALTALLCFSVLIPSKSDMTTIIGGGLAWKGISSTQDIEGLEKLPQGLVDAANKFIEDINEEE